MKILFITDFILAEEQGAKNSTIAHYNAIVELCGDIKNVDVVALNSNYNDVNKKYNIVYYETRRKKVQKLISILCGVPFLLSPHGERKIISICKKNKYDYIFVDHSIYGSVIKKIKEQTVTPVISFFHGIMQYQTSEYKRLNKTSLLYFLPTKNTIANERKTVLYSDACLVLNKRDDDNLYKYYKRHADAYLPLCLNDYARIKKDNITSTFELLFVGGYFWPNIHGITWFVKNVMPKLNNNIHLTIVGNNMDKLKDNLSLNNVSIFGRVDSLDDYYNNADVVVGPIFEGEGMKTKTCEALMYGKLYLGTDEALEGYELLNDYLCNTVSEFVERIQNIQKTKCGKFHKEMREMYIQHYSQANTKKIIYNVLNKLEMRKK